MNYLLASIVSSVAASLIFTSCSEPSARVPESGYSPLTLRIEDANASEPTDRVALEATFTNSSTRPYQIILPQDGSFYGWLSPTYEVSVVDGESAEAAFQLQPRCGNHGAVYNDKTLKRIEPGESLTLQLNPYFHIQESGESKVQLRYRVEADKFPGEHYQAPAAKTPRWRAWPKEVYVGELVSNVVSIHLAESRKDL